MSCRRMSPNESRCNVGTVVKNVMVVSYRNATDYTISFHTAVGQIPLINQNFQEKFSYAGNKITTSSFSVLQSDCCIHIALEMRDFFS